MPSALLPENAALELKRAYNSVTEMCAVESNRPGSPNQQSADSAIALYRRAMDNYRMHSPSGHLAAERWARAAKHLSEAIWHETKISYLRDRTAELPYLADAMSEYHLNHETEASASSLLEAYGERSHQRPQQSPADPLALLQRGQAHLAALKDPAEPRHELLTAERIKAANQYGRALECVFLAMEAESDAVASEEMANAKAA
jgi:hypothetical protein